MDTQLEPWPIITIKPTNKQSIRMFSMLHVKNPACPEGSHSPRLTGCGCLYTRNRAVAEEYSAHPPLQPEGK